MNQITREGSVSCPSCRVAIPASKENFVIYFAAGDELQCPGCSASLNWWELISKALSEGFLGLQYAPIGARMTMTEVQLRQGEVSEVDFKALGIPESARILEVVYTANEKRLPADADGGLLPLEMHSNRPDRQPLPDRPILLYPMPHAARRCRATTRAGRERDGRLDRQRGAQPRRQLTAFCGRSS